MVYIHRSQREGKVPRRMKQTRNICVAVAAVCKITGELSGAERSASRCLLQSASSSSPPSVPRAEVFATKKQLSMRIKPRPVVIVFALFISIFQSLAVQGVRLSIQNNTDVVLRWPSTPGQTFIIGYRPTLDASTPWTFLETAYNAAPSGLRQLMFIQVSWPAEVSRHQAANSPHLPL